MFADGGSSSCLTFERFSDALLYIITSRLKIKHCCKVLDDFLFIAETKELCQYALDAFSEFAKRIALPLAVHKTEGPSTCLTFLGIQIDTFKGELSIPQDKIKRYSNDIDDAVKVGSLTLKKLQSMTGKLQFVTSIIPVGRCFIRRLYDLTIGRSPHATITIDEGALADLDTWLSFLREYNAKELYAARSRITSLEHHIYADSSDLGYGATYENEYFYGSFPKDWLCYDIQVREFFPILILITAKATVFANKHVAIRTDNMSVAAAINTQTSKNRTLMRLLRKFVLILLKNNIKCSAYHIQGKKNTITDALSRLQVTKALLLFRQLGYSPKPMFISASLRPVNWSW